MAAVDIPAKATPQQPGEPVEVEQPASQMGSTFAERAAAAVGKKVTRRKVDDPQENSTFAERTKVNRKQVAAEDDGTENKAVKSAPSKSRKS